MMKRILFILTIACLVQVAYAQPAARRRAEQQQKSNAGNVTTRARIEFPVSPSMPEDVAWRRDIYREINLEDSPNAGLYYPVEPVDSRMNLFTYIFKLMMTGNIRAYQYRLDGNELFNDSSRIKPLAFLDNYHIYYERRDGRIKLDNSDIPSREVKSYYIKESVYYDQHTATFHTQVIALCPIMSREDDFGEGTTKYPLFWVKYEDLAPFLSKQTMMTSNLNNAATMSMDDYFTKHQYKGKIYKTTNMLGKTLAQEYPTDTAMTAARQRIEQQLSTFEKNIWGDPVRKDSLDSIARSGVKEKVVKKARRTVKDTETKTVAKSTKKTSAPRSTSATPRVSVRRQRH